MINRNPNCNHNNNNIFYQPSYGNIKYDDKNSKKEETLKKYFFPEADRGEGVKDQNLVEEIVRFMKMKGTQNFIQFLKGDVVKEFRRLKRNPEISFWEDEGDLGENRMIEYDIKDKTEEKEEKSPLSKMSVVNKTYFLVLLLERKINGNNLIKVLQTFQYFTPQRYDET